MIRNVSVHLVGNKQNDEPLILSQKQFPLNTSLGDVFTRYFLSSFKSEEYFHFHHDIDLSLNEVYTCVSTIFENPKFLQTQSENLAKHLYNQSVHPKIKGGEFYIAYFTDCVLRNEVFNAVGLFKSENKDTFLEIERAKDGFDVEARVGININKLDKGCLIYNTEKENGYILSIIDNTNKGSEAQYWKDNFLNVLTLNNDFHKTNQFLGITKQYLTKQLDEEFEVSKTYKIDLLNRSVDYFKTHDQFNKEEFEAEVFHHPNIIKSFKQFDQTYRQENGIELSEAFVISDQAVRKQARIFKSVLKLDKNFHIYIHGNRELIEQGIDERGRKFYKIYYEKES